MAIEVYCDYCGAEIPGGYATIESGGYHDGLGEYGHCVERRVHEYCSGDRDDEDTCYQRALRALADMKAWAHRGEGFGFTWGLVEQEKPKPTTAGKPRSLVGTVVPIPARIAAGTPLYKLDLGPRVVHSLYSANVATFEEVAERTEEEVAAINGVGPTTMRKLKAALTKARLSFRRDAEAVAS